MESLKGKKLLVVSSDGSDIEFVNAAKEMGIYNLAILPSAASRNGGVYRIQKTIFPPYDGKQNYGENATKSNKKMAKRYQKTVFVRHYELLCKMYKYGR